MAKLTYPIYDTIQLSDSAASTHTMFQQGQGTASNKAFQFTNMRGSGQFPDKEVYTIKKIGLHVDGIAFSDDDIAGLFVNSIVTITYNNVNVMQAPAYMFADKNRVGGIKTESSASAFDYFGQEGEGFMLENPLVIVGGKNFKVDFYQSLAVDTDGLDLKIVLYGQLDSPDIGI